MNVPLARCLTICTHPDTKHQMERPTASSVRNSIHLPHRYDTRKEVLPDGRRPYNGVPVSGKKERQRLAICCFSLPKHCNPLQERQAFAVPLSERLAADCRKAIGKAPNTATGCCPVPSGSLWQTQKRQGLVRCCRFRCCPLHTHTHYWKECERRPTSRESDKETRTHPANHR